LSGRHAHNLQGPEAASGAARSQEPASGRGRRTCEPIIAAWRTARTAWRSRSGDGASRSMRITEWARPASWDPTTGSSSSRGEIIEMSPIGSRHAGTVARIQRLPEPPDVRLLIVADSSLPYDRRTKFPLYARSGVTEAWLVDLERLEIHRGAGYRDVRIPRTDETFSPGAFVHPPHTGADPPGRPLAGRTG